MSGIIWQEFFLGLLGILQHSVALKLQGLKLVEEKNAGLLGVVLEIKQAGNENNLGVHPP